MNWKETRARLIELDIAADWLPVEWRWGIDLRYADLGEANLSRADLCEADLSGANLCEADLRGANLCGVNLRGVDLHGADLSGADLSRADLCRADLYGANLSGVDLRWAYLCETNLRKADLHKADLSGANLRWADLRNANLGGTNLRKADLHEANLRGADLCRADLDKAKWDYTTIGLASVPEGALIVWGKKGGRVWKMRVPETAARSWATTRKMRVSEALVVDCVGEDKSPLEHETAWGTTHYAIGEVARPDSWDPNRWNECSHGIHCFLSQHEAEEWTE